LEYAFTDGFNKLVNPKSKRVAILKGNGELEDRFLADFLKTLRDYYNLAPFTLDSVSVDPKRTLEQINSFDLIIAAKPTEAFTDAEKYVLDQYIMNGGASLWLVDATQNQQDSITGKTYVFPKDINLGDQFFKYGVRINSNLIKDLYSAPIVLATGSENDSQYNQYPWFFNPLSASANNHPIVTNLEGVKFENVSGIDTLPNQVKKTVLLSSSPITKLVGLPYEVDFETEIPQNLKIVNEGPNLEEYSAGEVPMAVLLEGKFPSFFTNRVTPFTLSEAKKESSPTKMVVISDGDIIANQFDKNRPLELGFDKSVNVLYGNKEFLLNTVNYLLDDSGLINIRTKEIAIPFLDPEKSSEKRTQWQLLTIGLPLVILGLFGLVFTYLRKKKYAGH
jgi:gliding-associated putative ABC transporter substrate-binding component GldG